MIPESSKFIHLIAAFAVCTLSASSLTAFQPRFPYTEGYTEGTDFQVQREVSPGVKHTFTSEDDGPLTINILEIDTSSTDLRLEAESGKDGMFLSETIPEMVERFSSEGKEVIAAINADFFHGNYQAVGLFIDEGMIWKGPWVGVGERKGKIRSVYAFDDQGNHFIGLPEFSVKLENADGSYLLIDRVNFHENSSYATIFNSKRGDRTQELRKNQKQIVLSNPSGEWLPNKTTQVTVTDINTESTHALDDTTLVIHADTPLPEWLKTGSELQLNATLEGLEGVVVGAVGGIPRLLKDGEVVVETASEEEAINQSFGTTKHPRTALGLKEDGKTLVWITVDGRQPGRSIGIGLNDLAEMMKEMGCIDAINLDGGGSTSMVVRGQTANFPSDATGPRAVSNGLIITSTAESREVASIELSPGSIQYTIPGVPVFYDVIALNEYGHKVEVDKDPQYKEPENSGWGYIGETWGTTHVVPQMEGSYRIDFSLAGEESITPVSADVRVLAPQEVTFYPPFLSMEPGESRSIVGAAKTAELDSPLWFELHYLMTELPEGLEWGSDNQIKAMSESEGFIEFELGDESFSLPFKVGELTKSVYNSFDKEPEAELSLRYASEGKTKLSLSGKEAAYEGENALKLDYELTPGGTSIITLPLDLVLPEEAVEVGMWVKGDGKGRWMRGVITDAAGNSQRVNFTELNPGIDWDNEWRFVSAPLYPADPSSYRLSPVPPTAPFTLTSVYIAETVEEEKGDGTIYLDALSVMGSPTSIQGESEVSSYEGSGDEIYPGVYHTNFQKEGPLNINVLEVDLTKDTVAFKAVLAREHVQGTEAVSSMAKRHDAIAGVNGDYWTIGGVPLGFTVVDGEVVIAPRKRSTFAILEDGTPDLDIWSDSWAWQTKVEEEDGETFSITMMNSDCNPGWLCLYTDKWNIPSRGKSVSPVVEAVLSPQYEVLEIRKNEEGVMVPADGYILTGRDAAGEWLSENLSVGETVKIDYESTRSVDNVIQAISAGPRILENGRFYEDPRMPFPDGEDFTVGWKKMHYENRHPRTAVGISKDQKKVILITVDGRMEEFSVGVTPQEMADLMLQYGAWEAMDLDSGGSTTMVINGEVVNHPSDGAETDGSGGRERQVSNALLIVPKSGE